MFLTASTTHIRRYNGVPEVRLDLNFRHASPKGTPKTLAQYEVLGTWHSHSWLCVFPPTWKPLECSSPRPTHIRRYNALQTPSPPAVKRFPAVAEQSQRWKPLTSSLP